MKKQTIKSIIKQTLIIGSLTLLLTSCSSTKEVELQGAGATFPYPLYSKMFTEYFRQSNVKINYQSVGSGAGVRQLKNKTVDFGAFVNFLGAKDGLVHISELQNARTEKTTDICQEGDMVKVKVIGFDDRGKVKLSMKRVDQETGADLEEVSDAE